VLAAPLTLVAVVIGRYIPDLEFVSVLLGNEPPLSDQQEFYHRLLSGDAYAAIDQIDEAKETSSAESVLDRLVFPSLHLAVSDLRRGRLDADGVKELEETVGEVASETLPTPGEGNASVLIIPVRGVFDTMAARFAAGAINAHVPNAASAMRSASGLMALSSIDLKQAPPPKKLVFITVTGIADKALAFLARKGMEKFPETRVLILDLTRAAGSISATSRGDSHPQAFNRLTDLMASVKSEAKPSDATSSAEISAEHSAALSESY
jgi:hypothetical protein